ncbi:MAG TPA: PrsW family glutamic-type intramembrane protease [Cytophagaceae bacterium]
MRFLLLYLLSVLLLIFLVNQFLEKPFFEKVYQKPHSQTFQETFEELKSKTDNPYTFTFHYQLIKKHFAQPLSIETPTFFSFRDDNGIKEFYQSYMQPGDMVQMNIGHFGHGFISLHNKLYSLAIDNFRAIEDSAAPYVNVGLGEAYLKLGQAHIAEAYFRKELAAREGDKDKASELLLVALYKQKKTEELKELYNNEQWKPYFDRHFRIKNDVQFQSGYVFEYLKGLSIQGNITGVIAAFLITLVWLFYLTSLNVFKKTEWLYIGITFVLGMLFTFLTDPITDFNRIYLGFTMNGGLLNDFFYCVIGIGAKEELVKFIPLLIILTATKAIKEPIDYIIYASVSALGFACVENILYFNKESMHIIHSRAFTAVVSHMFDSALIAYGLILAKYRKKGNQFLYFLMFFGLASLAHGFYDFWLINNTANIFYLLSIGFMLASMYLYITFVNNALNISPFFYKVYNQDSSSLKKYLIVSLTVILLFEYVATAFKKGAPVANDELIDTFLSASFFMVFFSTNLSNLYLIKNYWASVNFVSLKEKLKFKNLEGAIVEIVASKESKRPELFPMYGKVDTREVFSGDINYFKVLLRHPLIIGQVQYNYLVIRPKSDSDTFQKNRKIKARLLVPSQPELINQEEKSRGELHLMDIAYFYSPHKETERKSWLEGFKEKVLSGSYPALSMFVALLVVFVMGYSLYKYMNFKSSRMHYREAYEQLKIQDFYKAIAHVNAALSFDNHYPEAYLLWAKIQCEELNQYHYALENLEKVLKYSAQPSSTVYYLMAKAKLKLGLFEEAVPALEQTVLKGHPEDSAWYYLGATNLRLNRFEEAISAFKEFVRSNKSYEGFMELGIAHYRLKKYREGLENLEKAVEINRRGAKGYYYKGLCELGLQDTARACTDLMNANTLDYPGAFEMSEKVCRSDY